MQSFIRLHPYFGETPHMSLFDQQKGRELHLHFYAVVLKIHRQKFDLIFR